MSLRVQVVLSAEERARFHRQAARDGMSLSAWMREAAAARLAAAEAAEVEFSRANLDRLFRACDVREQGAEPDWTDHLRAIDAGRTGSTEAP